MSIAGLEPFEAFLERVLERDAALGHIDPDARRFVNELMVAMKDETQQAAPLFQAFARISERFSRANEQQASAALPTPRCR